MSTSSHTNTRNTVAVIEDPQGQPPAPSMPACRQPPSAAEQPPP
jgi:hypothetical protein